MKLIVEKLDASNEVKWLKEFLHDADNRYLLDTYQFDKLYAKINVYSAESLLTQSLLKSGINPLNYLTWIPSNFYAYYNFFQNYWGPVLNVPSNIKYIGYHAFDGQNIKKVNLSSKITSIRSGAFFSCLNLSEINLVDGLKRIDSHAFYYCSELTNIEIPQTTVHIGEGAFQKCSKLNSIKLPDALFEIPKYLFDTCTSLSDVELPQNLLEIDYYAFRNCSSLKSLTIPSTIEYIDPKAFAGCKNLVLKYDGTAEDWKRLNFNLPKYTKVEFLKQ